MVKIISKSRYIFIIVVMVPFILLNEGCFLFATIDTGVSGKISAIERKVDLLFESIERLNATNHEFIDKLDGLNTENKQLSKEYAQITKNQSSIKVLQEKQKSENEQFRVEMLSNKNLISEIRHELTTRTKPAKKKKKTTGKKRVVIKKAAKKPSTPKRIPKEVEKSPTSQIKEVQKDTKNSTESSVVDKKETQEQPKASLSEAEIVNKAYNRAKTLYRRGRYEEAISKWEEVLEIKPTMLDAMYNIEIAKDRIKARQGNSGE